MQDSPGGVPQVSRDMRRRESAESLPVTPPCDTHSVTGAATILHADLDAFYAAVEVRDQPTLRGRAVAVGGGVILSATYEARSLGVHAPMGIGTARDFVPASWWCLPVSTTTSTSAARSWKY